MKRFLKWMGFAVAVPIVLFLLLSIALYLPPVQDFAVQRVAAYASEATGMNISLERLRLSFPLDLSLRGLVVTDAEGDTLVAAREALVDLDLTTILRKRVGVEAITLQDARVNSKDLIATMALKGTLELFTLHDDVDLGAEEVKLSAVEASGLDLDIAMRDTTVIDTTESAALPWTILLERAAVTDARLRFAMPGDSMVVATQVASLTATDGRFDLAAQRYQVGEALLKADTLSLTLLAAGGDEAERTVPNGTGTTATNTASTGAAATNKAGTGATNKGTTEAGAVAAAPTVFALGATSLAMNGIDFDGERMHLGLPSIDLRTASSKVGASVDMDFAALEAGQKGAMNITVKTDLSKADLIALGSAYLPEGFSKSYPDVPLHIALTAEGNMDRLDLTYAEATLPGSIYMDAKGQLGMVTRTGVDSTQTDLRAGVDFNIETKNINWVRGLADGALDGIALPPMSMAGTATADGPLYGLQAQLREGAGCVDVKGQVDVSGAMSYDALLGIRRLNVRHFMPRDSIGLVAMTAKIKGSGTDIFHPATNLQAEAQVNQLQYGQLDLKGINLDATVSRAIGHLHAEADNPLLEMNADIDALLKKQTDLTFGLDLRRIDLHGLGLTERREKAAMCLHLDGSTNLKDQHTLSGGISDIFIIPEDTVYRPSDVTVEMMLRPDTTHVYLASGDLLLTANGQTAYDKLLEQFQHFMAEMERQIDARSIDQTELAHHLPQMDVHLRSGEKNPIHDMLEANGYSFEDIRLDLNFDPFVGVNGGGHLHKLNTGALILDTIAMHVYQDSTGVKMDARVRNGRRNPQVTFDARLNAEVLPSGASAKLVFYDQFGRKGVDLGAQFLLEEDNYRIHLDPLNPIIAYRTFHLNDNNFVSINRDSHIHADLDLIADDGTGLKLYSTENAEALQDLSLSVNHLNLGELSSVLPYMPKLAGLLHGDAHFIQTAENISVSTEMDINNLSYEGAPLGQVGLQAVYLPNADGSHFIDGSVLQTGMPIATFSGSYTPDEKDGQLDLNATLDRFPFSMANGFIPDGMARLEGVAIGDIHVGGSTSKPLVNGHLRTDGLKLLSEMYSLDLRFADDTIHVRNSDLRFDRFEVYSTGKTPFVVDGGVNFADLDRITIDMNMAAKDYELINARKTHRNRNAVAYGKVFVDFNAMLRGTLDNLSMYGKLKVLGDTDVTYIMGDSPLTVEDQLADLVEFVDFQDSIPIRTEVRENPQNLRITMGISIDNAAQAHVLLSADGSSYVDLEGGGDLTMSYTPEKDLQLNGRYTINSGTLKYTMMVIPLKEFSIKSGSYVEFRGPLMNPHLNLSATERLRTTITENDQPRSVNFDVGMNITQTLENLGLEFTLDAPEDMSIQNELASMSTEQRGRVAVTMLATGMYITDNNATSGGGFSTQNALNAFLQSQITSIAGKALKSVDLSLGVEQGTSATGATTTDYSFRFAKRFWGNRISVIVGGKVSTGEDAQNTGQTLIDNVSVEYRLDKSASRSISVFYDKNYESLLEGEVIEMGAGLVLRKKAKAFGELFIFKNK